MGSLRFTGVAIGLISLFGATAQQAVVNFSKERQSIVYMGINMEGYHTTGGAEVLRHSLSRMMNSLPVNAVRVGLPLKEWEPVNDNDNPEALELGRFGQSLPVRYSFERLKLLDSRHVDIWLSVWDMADWNVSNPAQETNRRMVSLPEMAESICAYLVRARDEYGVEVRYVSVNEPSVAAETGYGGYNIGFSAEEQAALIDWSSRLFARHGLKTKWIVAIHNVNPSEVKQAQTIWKDLRLKDKIAAFDFHAYGLNRRAQYDFVKQWGEWIATTGLPAYCGELDYDNAFWKREAKDKKEWKSHGMITAKLYALIFNEGYASAAFPWYANAPSASTPYRYVAWHYHSHLLPSYRVVESSVSDSTLSVVAATDRKSWVVLLQNDSPRHQTVCVKGLPDGLADVIASYTKNYGIRKPAVRVDNGVLRLPMEPYSLYSIGNHLR